MWQQSRRDQNNTHSTGERREGCGVCLEGAVRAAVSQRCENPEYQGPQIFTAGAWLDGDFPNSSLKLI